MLISSMRVRFAPAAINTLAAIGALVLYFGTHWPYRGLVFFFLSIPICMTVLILLFLEKKPRDQGEE
jgi:hypothetical protein